MRRTGFAVLALLLVGVWFTRGDPQALTAPAVLRITANSPGAAAKVLVLSPGQEVTATDASGAVVRGRFLLLSAPFQVDLTQTTAGVWFAAADVLHSDAVAPNGNGTGDSHVLRYAIRPTESSIFAL